MIASIIHSWILMAGSFYLFYFKFHPDSGILRKNILTHLTLYVFSKASLSIENEKNFVRVIHLIPYFFAELENTRVTRSVSL